jgi:hypothetical protein
MNQGIDQFLVVSKFIRSFVKGRENNYVGIHTWHWSKSVASPKADVT